MIANEIKPWLRLPPTQKAASAPAPSTAETAANHHLGIRLAVNVENLLHRSPEEARERDRERQRGEIPPLLDRHDRLTGHAHRGGQLDLREASLRPQLPDHVLHCDVKVALHLVGVKLPLHHDGRATGASPIPSRSSRSTHSNRTRRSHSES